MEDNHRRVTDLEGAPHGASATWGRKRSGRTRQVKILSGQELAGFIKERQAHEVRTMTKKPTLLIIRDSDNPVIQKYVNLKIKYGEDIGIRVIDFRARDAKAIQTKINEANTDPSISGIIIQLPLTDKTKTEELTALIAPAKDVDGLGPHAKFDSATATAINWLLAGYDIKLDQKKIAIVGRGKLVGAPLAHMFQNSGYDVTVFHRGDDLTNLKQYDIIISATGVPGLISDDMVSPGACLVDAGTASEKGRIIGDLSDALYERTNLSAITPQKGGVGPLTIACLFEHVIQVR